MLLDYCIVRYWNVIGLGNIGFEGYWEIAACLLLEERGFVCFLVDSGLWGLGLAYFWRKICIFRKCGKL